MCNLADYIRMEFIETTLDKHCVVIGSQESL